MLCQCRFFIFSPWLLILISGWTVTGYAEPVGNGNEMALGYATNTPTGRQLIQQTSRGVIHTFRYLKVTEIKKDTPTPGAITLMTVEPSSSMRITLIVTKKLSLDIANSLTINECVAANGRVKSIGTEADDLIVLDPVVIKHKDRSSPKQKVELLREVDSGAH